MMNTLLSAFTFRERSDQVLVYLGHIETQISQFPLPQDQTKGPLYRSFNADTFERIEIIAYTKNHDHNVCQLQMS